MKGCQIKEGKGPEAWNCLGCFYTSPVPHTFFCYLFLHALEIFSLFYMKNRSASILGVVVGSWGGVDFILFPVTAEVQH